MKRGPQRIPGLVPQRLQRTKERVDELVWTGWRELEVFVGPPTEEPIELSLARRKVFEPVAPGQWLPARGSGPHHRWFQMAIPDRRVDEEAPRPYLHWACDGSSTVHIEEGGERPWAALDPIVRTCPLPERTAVLWLECSAADVELTDVLEARPEGMRFGWARIAARDPAAWQASCDLEALLQLVKFLASDSATGGADRGSPLLRQLLHALDVASDAFDRGSIPAFSEALEAVFHRFPAEAWQPVAAICAQGEARALSRWPEEEAARRGARGWASMLRLLDAYPAFVFGAGEPALYRAIERHAPALAAEVRERIKQRRWEASGGFEIEPDAHIPCGEALARSLVLGQRKLAELRGTPNVVSRLSGGWGFPGCLPQLLRLGGVKHFVTTRPREPSTNRLPHHSFVWEGDDGSEVLAQVVPTSWTRHEGIAPLVQATRDFAEVDVSSELLVTYGDGGITDMTCERIKRLGDLSGVPHTRFVRTEDFFGRLAAARDKLPVHHGELRREHIHGTYTARGDLKRLYRRAEGALQTREAVRVATGGGPIEAHPWLRLSLAQAQGRLATSAISTRGEQLRAELESLGDNQMKLALGELAHEGSTPPAAWGWNPLALPRRALVQAGPGEPLIQIELPALGAAPLERREPFAPVREASPRALESGLVRANFDHEGRLVGLRVCGESLALTSPAGLALFVDDVNQLDAVDAALAFRQGGVVAAPSELQVIESSALRAVLRGEMPIGSHSRAVVDYVLEAGSPWLGVSLDVDWQEEHRLLKYHVPTDYRGRVARFGAPFGSVQRAQQPDARTSESAGELPASRWAAITDDDGAGLAIVTEAKYGFSCGDGALGLWLLRAPAGPDPEADRGRHVIRFAIGQHRARTGDQLSTAAAAEALFAPVLLGRGQPPPAPPFRLAPLGSLVPSWVLPAEEGGFVIRLHETAGARGAVELVVRDGGRAVDLVDLFERPIPELGNHLQKVATDRWSIAYRPYQILGVRVRS